jgi:uncharacterized protein YozE (UPF0346 family)
MLAAYQTFHQYMQTRRRTKTTMGDFVEDAVHDKQLPDAQTWDELESYLIYNHACAEALRVGRRWWARYQKHLAKE